MKLNRLLCATLCALSSSFAYAEATLNEVVVTATRSQVAANHTLSSTTILTEQDIKQSQAADLPSILRGVAGVEISQSGGVGKVSNLYIRGSNRNHSLVLVDGVRLNSATDGPTAIQDIMLDQVERIEVVRGNVSSLYGSEAMGGVIQIFTKRGKGAPHFNASGGIGNQGTKRASAGFGGDVGGTAFNLQVSHHRTDGVSQIDPSIMSVVNPENDGYKNTSVSGNVRHAFNEQHSVSLGLLNSQGKNQYDSTDTSSATLKTDDNTNEQKLQKWSIASDNQFTRNWQSHVQYAQGIDQSRNFTNGKANVDWSGKPASLLKTENRQLTWQNNLRFDKNNILLGVDRLEQTVSGDTIYTAAGRHINSFFAGYTAQYGSLDVQLNARQDRNSQYGTANTGLFGLGYHFNQQFRATASYSTAFRAPTFNEVYAPASWGANPALRPERSRNLEVGGHYVNDNQRVSIVYFDNKITDMVQYQSVSPYMAQNVSRARIDGLELSYTAQFNQTGIRAALTSQDPRDESTGQALLRRTQLHSSLAVTQQLADAWRVGGEWLHSGERDDKYFDPVTFSSSAKTLPSYNVLNVSAGYQINKNLSLAAKVNNMTNQNDSSVYGYQPIGRNVFVGLNYQ